MRATPLTPPVRLVQNVSTSFPMGVMAPIPVTTARRRSSRPMPARSVPPATEDDCAVVTSEPHRVREGHSNVGGARLVGDVVEGQVRIRMPQVDGGRDAAGLQDLGAYESFEGARGSHHVAGHALGGANGQLAGMVPKDRFDRDRLVLVVERRAGAVRVDVADLFRTDGGAFERRAHRPLVALPALSGSR